MSQVKNSIPEGWVQTTLGNEAIINPRESIKKGEIKVNVPMACIDSFTKKINVFEKNEFKGGTKFRNGDTLLARITPCLENGKTAFVDILDDDDEVGFGSTEYIVIREKKNHTDKQFLYYLSISPHFREIAIKAMTGTSGRQRVQTDVLVNKTLPFPPLSEQKAIAKVLTAFDDKIENLRAQNETLEQTAQTIFTEWFGKYKIGDELPAGFRELKLGEVTLISAGGDKPKNSTDLPTEKNRTPIYSNGITNDGLYGFTGIPKIIEESVTVSARGTIGFVCIRFEPYVPIVRLISVVPNKSFLTNKYLFYYLKNLNIQGVGTTQQQLTVPTFKNTEIIIPPSKLIIEFTNVVDSLYSKINKNNEQIQSLSQTRDTLLPKLMSGQLRVKGFDK